MINYMELIILNLRVRNLRRKKVMVEMRSGRQIIYNAYRCKIVVDYYFH